MTCRAVAASVFIFASAFSPSVFGQAPQPSVTVTVSRPSSVPPDQMSVYIYVTSPATATLSDVLSAVQGSGLTAANLIGVSSVPASSDASPSTTTSTTSTSYTIGSLSWNFYLTVPMVNFKSAIGTLSAVQASLAKLNNGLSIDVEVAGASASTQALQAQSCPLSDLVSDARAQAQKIASASNMSAGAIIGMQSSLTNGLPSNGACSLTVKFALGAF